MHEKPCNRSPCALLDQGGRSALDRSSRAKRRMRIMTENTGVHTNHSSNEVRRIRSAYAERERTHKSNEGNPGRQRLLRERNETLGRILALRLQRPFFTRQ